MQCAKCGSENPLAKKYCGDCGAPLGNSCPKCGAENPAGKNFCGDCGALLESGAPRRTQPKTHDDGGERRHLTVLFCDLVGSTQIATHLDPEEWRETVAGYHRAAAEAITRCGGNVAKYLGDGLMAFFGYPEAHDNDAERAARAGLAILEAIAKLNEQSGQPKLSARIGIDSGGVVVGAGAGKDADVFGDAPNIAARVQEAAAPGTVMVTEDTQRLISGLFVVEARQTPELKGVERPIQLYRIIQPSGVRGRLEAAAARGLTPFVGREDELRLLMSRWKQVLDGEGQVTLIIGEAGIGKSRLLERFHEEIAGIPHTSIEAVAAPLFHNTPFYPVADMLRQALAWRGNESAEEQIALLEPRLELAGLRPAEAIPLLAPLLNLPLPSKYPPSSLSAEQRRRRLLATLVELALGTARLQPTVITTEDLHWADPSTLELIQLLVEQGATARLLLLYTARPEFRVQWPLRAHHTQITLNRLSSNNVRKMVGQVAARKALPEETITAVVERTGGVPLFVEELTRALLESSDLRLTEREIPVTLHDSLMARLGRAKEVIQIGAVIGSEFSYELLHAVHPIADEDLQQALRTLADAELLYVRGIAPDASYLFKHALIRDAAYEALLKSRRKELHRLVARTIEEEFSALKQTHPEVIAHHWTQAGETEPAIAQWSIAGKAAEGRNAFGEALESYKQSLSLITALPESPERHSRELELRQSLVGMLSVTKGYSRRETIEAIEAFAALAGKSGTLPQLGSWIVSKCLIAFSSADMLAAGMLADQALELALREGNPETIAGIYSMEIAISYYRGDLAVVEKHFTAGLKFLDDPGFKRYPGAGLSAFSIASWNAWMLGRTGLARERGARMMAGVNRNNPYDLAVSGCSTALLSDYMREYEQAEALASRALELCEKHQILQIAAESRIVLGHARAQLGRATGGADLVGQGITCLHDLGSRVGIAAWTTRLAAAQACEGAIAEALETVEQALQASPDELASRPETLRLRGELRLKQGQTEPAEAGFHEAIDLARSVGAKAWELRSTKSLVEMLAKQGRRDEARSKLAEIYNWFTEGFDTADLRDAKALLEELGT